MWIEVAVLLVASGFCSWRCARWYFPFVVRMRGNGLRGVVLATSAWIGFSVCMVLPLFAAILVLRPPLTMRKTLLLCMIYVLSLIPAMAQIPRHRA